MNMQVFERERSPMPTPRDRDEPGGDIPRSTYLGVPRRFMRGITTVLVAALVNTALLPLTHAQQLQSAQAARTLALEQATSPTAADRYYNALPSTIDRLYLQRATSH